MGSILMVTFLVVGSQLPTSTIGHMDTDCTNIRGCPTADGTFQENNGNCFHFSEKVTHWEEARKDCQILGRNFSRFGDLAELGNPKNLGSDYWLMETIARKGNVSGIRTWLGGYSPRENDHFIWAHSGRTLGLDFPLWGPNEPSGDGPCVDAWPLGDQGRYYLNDEACNYPNNYVCQLF